MTPPRWLRDTHPTEWLEGRADALLDANNPQAPLARTAADAEQKCTARLMTQPKQAAYWAGYAIAMAEQDEIRTRRERGGR